MIENNQKETDISDQSLKKEDSDQPINKPVKTADEKLIETEDKLKISGRNRKSEKKI